MLIRFFASILLLSIFIFVSVYSQNNIRNYVVHQDFLADVKKREYNIFDQTESNLVYYIEAGRLGFEKIQVFASPSKQLVGTLKRVFSFMYKASISVLDSRSNRWINGTIKQNMRLLGSKYTIEWNGEKVSMKTKVGLSMAIEFHDEKNKNRLGVLRRRLSSVLLASKYDLAVFTDKLPDAIYLLTLAVHEYQLSKQGTN
jgi:hypothetical protein